jgi:hypothetical protein
MQIPAIIPTKQIATNNRGGPSPIRILLRRSFLLFIETTLFTILAIAHALLGSRGSGSAQVVEHRSESAARLQHEVL